MAAIKALFFDMDGVIIDTERDGHRVAFNEAFISLGFDFQWDVEKYHALLQVAGGKERMKHYFQEEGLFAEFSPAEMKDLLLTIHKKKTGIFLEMLETGKLPLRPGIKRFMKEAMELDLLICVCTTANEKAAGAVTRNMLAEITFAHVLAGDIVKKKKPDPEIYTLALQKTGLSPDACIVIEDSAIGVLAAKAAGLRVIATTNGYTEQEDLSQADIIVSSLGDVNGEKGRLKTELPDLVYNGILHVDQVMHYFSNLKPI
jgi:HAD superfamily hydrolase (TIGR01509 family)